MRRGISSRIMRTTIDIDDLILKDLKRLQQREGKTLGRLVTDLLADALARQPRREQATIPLVWVSKPLGALVDLADHDALQDAMDQDRLR